MKDHNTCSVCIECTIRTNILGTDDYFSTTYFRKCTISESRKDLIHGLLLSCKAVYDSEKDIYYLPSHQAYNAALEYLTYNS